MNYVTTLLAAFFLPACTFFSNLGCYILVVAAEIKVAESKEEVSFVEMECEESIPLPEIAADWWGTKYGFVRSGALGSKVRETVNGERPRQNGRTQFSEQDQENLYNLVNVSCH